jgi:MFS family permease
MGQLGTLLLVATATGSYGKGGLAAGTFAVSNAIGASLAGALADRIGQRPVVLVQSVLGAVALTSLVVLVNAEASQTPVLMVAAVAGMSTPQVGPLARGRWRPFTRDEGSGQRRLIDAAFSYEGAADEASFVMGPALIGVIAVALNPGAGLLTAAVLLLVFGTWFALHPSATLTRSAHTLVSPGRLVTGAFTVLLTAQLLIGVVFGATQTGTTVLATTAGQAGLAGLVHAMLGVGSVLAGLAVAGLPTRWGYEQRLMVFAVGLAGLSTPLLMVHTLGALVPAVTVLGLAVAPYMISVFTLAERIVPGSRVGAAMTLLAGATGIGYALGSSLAGRLADGGGHTPAFAVTVAAAMLAVALTTSARSLLATALYQEVADQRLLLVPGD